jgi:hypothetical protein
MLISNSLLPAFKKQKTMNNREKTKIIKIRIVFCIFF